MTNLPPQKRRDAQAESQGRDPETGPCEEQALVKKYADRGTHLVRPRCDQDSEQEGMPAAVMSSNVGGMGVHWACATPRPLDSERVPFLADEEFETSLEVAEDLLNVTQKAFDPTEGGRFVEQTLSDLFDAEYPAGRAVEPMPLSCVPRPGKVPLWGGTDIILRGLPTDDSVFADFTEAQRDGGDGGFRIAAETICRRVLFKRGRATGAVLEHLPTGIVRTVRARTVAVAADALRTPQLLWASGIRPRALGRYLNDQPKIVSSVQAENGPTVGAVRDSSRFTEIRDLQTGRFWVPFTDPGRPRHGQVMTVDTSSVEGLDPALFAGMNWYCAKEIQPDDRVEFSDTEVDAYGMPKMTIHHSLTSRDREQIALAVRDQESVAAALGPFLPGNEPTLYPSGSSKHYQGSTRMGPVDDGTSVCDTYSRVWGFENLYVGGNGVIPTSTASNPTLFSVALAVRAADSIGAQLARG
ncbi:GMC oxidoreductase [Streptomyces sp. NPDC002519]